MLAAYSNHFHNGFHFDDGHTIVNNAAIRYPGNIPRFFGDATTFSILPSNQSYRPLVSTLLAIAYWSGGGPDPFAFHILVFGIFVALDLARRADQLAAGKDPVFLRTIVAAYAENGRFEEAMATAERAQQLAVALGNSTPAENLREDLSFYERRHALHP